MVRTISFDSSEFTDLKGEIISQHKWSYYEVGSVKKALDKDIFYLIFIDNSLLIIDKKKELTPITLNKVTFSKKSGYGTEYSFTTTGQTSKENNTFYIHKQHKKPIELYIKSIEKLLLNKLNEMQKELLSNQKIQTILTNFLEQFCNDFFIKLDLPNYYEDDLFEDLFNRKKKLKYFIKEHVRNRLENQFFKVIELIKKKELVDNDLLESYGNFLLLRTLMEIAMEYYPMEFQNKYGGYFSDDTQLNLDECIESYFSIDFMTQTEEKNIGLLTYYLYSKQIKEFKKLSLFNAWSVVKDKVEQFEKDKKLFQFELLLSKGKTPLYQNGFDGISIDDVDLMSGIEFEGFISDMFKRMGYSVNMTPKTGDQGIDLIAVKSGLRIGIQAKCYSNSVSNKAVQEVVAGVNHYSLSKAVVITNNYFTKSAAELAISNNVTLWDRKLIKEKIIELY